MVAIGVGQYEDFEGQLEEIAGNNVHSVESFDQLSNLFQTIIAESCSKSTRTEFLPKSNGSLFCPIRAPFLLSSSLCQKLLRRAPTISGTGTLRSDDGEANENVTLKYNFILFVLLRDYFNSFNFYRNPGTKLVRLAFELRKRMKNSPSCARVLHKTLNLVI